MNKILQDLFYKWGVLTLIDYCLSKISDVRNRLHVFINIKKLENKGAVFGKNVYIDSSVRLRISEKSILNIGDDVRILNDSWLITEDGDELVIGDNTFISQNVVISGNVSVGRDSLIAGYVSIIDANHNYSDVKLNINAQGGNKRSITIGSDVWIGTHSVILQGVNIGDHSIIGANSTVTKSIGEYIIAAGSPAEIIKKRI